MGIPLKTRHREVAPNQYEFAPMFGNAITQVDQNLMIMQIIEEVASEHGLAALLQEKPFAGINGSGKHNNWSIGTSDGLNLMNPKQVNAKTGNAEIFPLVMAAMVSAIDKHGDLMRLAIASPGNDFRLGAMEAPPAVMSTYLGPSITEFLNKREGWYPRYVHAAKEAAQLSAPTASRRSKCRPKIVTVPLRSRTVVTVSSSAPPVLPKTLPWSTPC